jgi:hypothetical protein
MVSITLPRYSKRDLPDHDLNQSPTFLLLSVLGRLTFSNRVVSGGLSLVRNRSRQELTRNMHV